MAENADDDSKRNLTYLTIPLLDLVAERELPGPLYLCLQHKMVRYRHKGDSLDSAEFNKLVYSKVKFVFIEESDRRAFEAFIAESKEANAAQVREVADQSPEAVPIAEAAQATRRAMMDLFENPRGEAPVRAAVELSKKLVTEFLRKPFALNNIAQLQNYSKGCVDHSVNVGVLSVFLGLRMGYTHQLILENLAQGGLFHDLGKLLVETKDGALTSEDDPAMQQHPRLGHEIIEKIKEIPNEVQMIVAQHHEMLDGSGYPTKLRGLAVYDLARLVAIANLYDNLVTKSRASTVKERQREALDHLAVDYPDKLDPKKLEKVIKILKYSFI